jgi:TonB family protein
MRAARRTDPMLAAAGLALSLLVGDARAEGSPPVDARPPVEDAIAVGPSVEARLAEIQRRVQAALVFPPLARQRGLEGSTRVGFVIDAAGRADGVHTVVSSGSALLDRAAERAVRDAGALPYVYGDLVIPVRFALHEGGG